MAHTILLVQPGRRVEDRTFCDYDSVTKCMEGICKIYEEHLRRRSPHSPTITYNIAQLHDFIDNLYDLSCLVYQRSSQSYFPHGKEWIKQRVCDCLTKQVGK